MERVRPKKLAPEPAPVERVQPTQVRTRLRPAKQGPDPAELPAFDTHGYGPLRTLGFKTGIALSYRIKQDGDSQVRIYYAGAFLIGVVCLSPTQATASFRHNMTGPDHVRYKDEAEMHRAIFAMLQEQPE